MGRPTKLTPKVRKAIIEAVRKGNYPEVAAQAAGVCRATFYNWKARGQEGGKANQLYVDFLDALTYAEAEAEVTAVEALRCSFGDDWRAAAEYLRRRHNGRWSTTDRIEHGGEVKHGVSIDLSKLPQETLDQLEHASAD